jgi:ABC-type multidrug transport system ATPase subunit
MGPSGSGKTMLLNRLALRGMPAKAKLSGFAYVNESPVDTDTIRSMSSYVEQQDHLIGSITAAETLYFAGKLSSSVTVDHPWLCG